MQCVGDLPATPTFLPYLLKFDDESPQELLKRALKLRTSGVVGEYRRWRREVIENLEKGRVPNKLQTEIAQIAAAITRELKANYDGKTKVSAKVSAKLVFVGPIPVFQVGPEAGIEKEVHPAVGLGWILRHIPGYRYRKLLMRLVIAQREYRHIDMHLKSIWSAV